MAYIAFDVRPGGAPGIARFYRDIMGRARRGGTDHTVRTPRSRSATSSIITSARPMRRRCATTAIMPRSTSPIFSGPHKKLIDLGLITREFDAYEYRFNDIIDLDTREVLFTVEHEVRAQTHPMFGRPLVNATRPRATVTTSPATTRFPGRWRRRGDRRVG